MSHNMPGNPYAGREPHTEADGIMSALDTLSFEQRTANLLAFLDQCNRNGGTGPEVYRLQKQVIARLGLDQEATS